MTLPSVARRLDAADRVRRDLVRELEAMDPALLGARPRPGKWSIQEIVEHLVLAERAFLKGLERGTPPGPRSLKHALAYPMVMFILRWDIPVKVPSRAMVPTGERGFAELREAWDANHRALREFVAGLDPASARRPVTVHPVAGPMDARRAVVMLDVHLRRHARQIRRLRTMLDGVPPA